MRKEAAASYKCDFARRRDQFQTDRRIELLSQLIEVIGHIGISRNAKNWRLHGSRDSEREPQDGKEEKDCSKEEASCQQASQAPPG